MGSFVSQDPISIQVSWKYIQSFLCNPADKPTNKLLILIADFFKLRLSDLDFGQFSFSFTIDKIHVLLLKTAPSYSALCHSHLNLKIKCSVTGQSFFFPANNIKPVVAKTSHFQSVAGWLSQSDCILSDNPDYPVLTMCIAAITNMAAVCTEPKGISAWPFLGTENVEKVKLRVKGLASLRSLIANLSLSVSGDPHRCTCTDTQTPSSYLRLCLAGGGSLR